MRTPDDAYTAGAVRASDELLDRLGRRRPTTGDLDDPVAATLALFAGEVDLEPADPGTLRRTLLDKDLWPPRPAPDVNSDSPGDGRAVSRGPDRATPRTPHPRPPLSPRSGVGPLLVPRPPDPAHFPRRRLGPHHRWDRTELVLLTTGLALAVGGVTLLFTGGPFHHLVSDRESTAQESPAHSSTPTETRLWDLITRAENLADSDPATARALLEHVERALPDLAPRVADPLADAVERTRRLLPADSDSRQQTPGLPPSDS
ncbi:MAG: hypothetical protein QG608_1994 [Actinomycetota bacterium]|nr:hypothetical protein [Actinomycetota bacterium]